MKAKLPGSPSMILLVGRWQSLVISVTILASLFSVAQAIRLGETLTPPFPEGLILSAVGVYCVLTIRRVTSSGCSRWLIGPMVESRVQLRLKAPQLLGVWDGSWMRLKVVVAQSEFDSLLAKVAQGR